ncbi:MAG: hypothetical protein H0U00_03865 [Actinobacteria bacterium]|nr:hypothetical protein [Actinomycetota bacterium]
MFEPHLHLDTENLHRELREIALQRPRLDRPIFPTQKRFRKVLRAFVQPPAQATYKAGERVPNVTIRPALATDLRDLARLAELSERRVPSGLVLVAEVESSIVAALPVEGGPMLSDFRTPTRDVAQLLELRSEQIRTTVESARAA